MRLVSASGSRIEDQPAPALVLPRYTTHQPGLVRYLVGYHFRFSEVRGLFNYNNFIPPFNQPCKCALLSVCQDFNFTFIRPIRVTSAALCAARQV